MRALGFVLLAAALALAGCSAAPAPPGPGPEDGGPGRVSDPGSHKGSGDNRTTFLDLTIEWVPDAAPASATMAVPANATDLELRVTDVPLGPCGTNTGEPGDPFPYVEFTAPSGAATRFDLFANECDVAGATVATTLAPQALPAEAGDWQVTFHGRGIDLQQHLVVDGLAA